MPLAKPHKGESKRAFLSRCYSDKKTRKEFTDQEQLGGYCYHAWKDHKAHAAYVVEAGGDEYAFAKEPIDSDIQKRNKTASNPPKNALPGLNPNGGVTPNPYNSTVPSSDLPDRGSDNQEKKGKGEKVDSMDQGKKPNLDDMSWMMGEEYVPILDEHTGLAKWPLSFKRIEKDTKRPNKPYHKDQDVPKDQRKPEQPSTAV